MDEATVTDLAGGQGRRGSAAARGVVLFGVALAIGAVAMLVLAPRFVSGELPHPGCGLKRLTGLPCPGCGGLRGLAVLAEGKVGPALELNPLLAGGCLLMLTGLPVALFDAFLNRGRMIGRWQRLLEHRHLGWAMAAVVALNWVYLLMVGR
jgi:hypothetical protein